MSQATMGTPVDLVRALRRALSKSKRHMLVRPVARLVARLDKGSAKLFHAAYNAHDVLFRADTVFPFNLFPDTVTVDREKLTIANRFFFRVAKITSVPIRDILSVEADVGPFFGSVYMTSRYFFTNPHSINFLWRKDALKMQQLLQGYIIAHEQHIDCSKMDKQQLVTLLNDLGKGDTD